MLLLVAASAMGCAPTPDDNGGVEPNPNNGYVAPEVPETPVASNLFRVDYFSALDGEPFFEMRDVGVASQFVSSQAAPRSIAYMFDRADFVIGASQPIVKIAYDNKANPFFIPTALSTTAPSIKGTAVVSRYASSKIDGTAQEGLCMSGIRFSIGLSKATPIVLYTATFEKVAEVELAVERFGVALQSDGVLIASVASSEKAAVEEWLKYNFEGYRVAFAGSEGTPYDVMVLCPAMMVCRSIEPNKTINLPYWKVTMEKFF